MKYKKVTAFFLMVAIVIFSSGISYADLSYDLNFEDEQDLDYFVVPDDCYGEWEITDGELMQTVPRSGADYYIEDYRQILSFYRKLPESFVLELSFTHVDADWFGIAFGIDDSKSTYQDDGGQGYIWIFSNAETSFPRLDFYKCTSEDTPMWAYGNENYMSAKIKNGRIVAAHGIVNYVRFVKDGDSVRIYVENTDDSLVNAFGLDGEPTLEFTEDELDGPGYLQLVTGRGRVRVHDFNISPLADETDVVPSDTPAESQTKPESTLEDTTEDTTQEENGGILVYILIPVVVIVIAAVVIISVKKKK